MKKQRGIRYLLAALVIIVLLVTNGITVYNLFEIKSNQKKITRQMKTLEDNVNNEVNGITNSIVSSLEKQNSLVSSYSFSYGELNAASGKIDTKVDVIPKECEPKTQIKITYQKEGGKVYSVAADRLSDNQFSASLRIPYDEDYRIGIILSNGQITRQEYLDWVYSLKDQMQIQVNGAYLNDSVQLLKDDSIRIEGEVHAECYPPTVNNTGLNSNQIQSVKTKIYVNYEEVDSYDMENIEQENETRNYVAKIDGKYELKIGDKFEIAVEISDTAGFHYKTYAYQGRMNTHNEMEDDDYSYGYVEITP